MPKERRLRSASFERKSRASPFSSANQKHPSSSRSMTELLVSSAKDVKEWEEVRCPVCMEYPHNAVLLHCSSRDNGCSPFMCDTSYRHSNCLDQFKKAFAGSYAQQDDIDGLQKSKLLCPLCRGQVSGWEVVEPARRYMNAKTRSCSLETCSFIGTYRELRKHARTDHPSTRPTDTDPERERDWRRMEQQRDFGDLMSSLQATIGGSRSSTGIDGLEEEEGDVVISSYPLHPVAFYLVVRFRVPASRNTEHSSRVQTRSSSRRRHRLRGESLWGETLSEQEPNANPMSTNERFLSIEHVGNNAGDSMLVEASGSSQRSQYPGRLHRQFIISSDDDNDDDDDAS